MDRKTMATPAAGGGSGEKPKKKGFFRKLMSDGTGEEVPIESIDGGDPEDSPGAHHHGHSFRDLYSGTVPRSVDFEAELKAMGVKDEGASLGISPDLWGKELKGHFPSVKEQVETGIRTNYRTAQFFERVMKIEREYATALIELFQREQGYLETHRPEDKMKTMASCWLTVIQQFHNLGLLHQEFAELLEHQVIFHLNQLRGEIATEADYVFREEKNSAIMVKSLGESLKAKKVKALKHLESAGLGDAKGVRGVLVTVSSSSAKNAALAKAYKDAAAYEEEVQNANNFLVSVKTQSTPQLIKKLQMLELYRHTKTAKIFAKMNDHLTKVPEHLTKFTNKISDSISGMSPKFDLEAFVKTSASVTYTLEEQFKNDLPLTAEELKKKLDASGYSKDGKSKVEDPSEADDEKETKSVFFTTLEKVMALQKESHPTLTLPLIVHHLIGNLYGRHAATYEGIFRKSVDKDHLDSFVAACNEENYELVSSPTPHLHAAGLKHWLRSLTQPIIPEELYGKCITIGRLGKTTKEELRSWMNYLPEKSPRRVLLNAIIELCQNISHPDNVEYSKMTANNLAVVFSPSLLRCPSTDPEVILKNTAAETAFLKLLFELHQPEAMPPEDYAFMTVIQNSVAAILAAAGAPSATAPMLISLTAAPTPLSPTAGAGAHPPLPPFTRKTVKAGEAAAPTPAVAAAALATLSEDPSRISVDVDASAIAHPSAAGSALSPSKKYKPAPRAGAGAASFYGSGYSAAPPAAATGAAPHPPGRIPLKTGSAMGPALAHPHPASPTMAFPGGPRGSKMPALPAVPGPGTAAAASTAVALQGHHSPDLPRPSTYVWPESAIPAVEDDDDGDYGADEVRE